MKIQQKNKSLTLSLVYKRACRPAVKSGLDGLK